MEKHISAWTIPANQLGNQIFVSAERGMWIRAGHRCPHLEAWCFSVLLGFSNKVQGCSCGVFQGHCTVSGEMLCPLTPPEFGVKHKNTASEELVHY